MVKYFVRTTLERQLDNSYSQIEYELLADTEHNPVKSFIDQLEYLGTLECDVVLLEDDLILCNEFKTKIEKVIKKYKNNIIQFFTLPSTYFTTHITDDTFKFNQCTYYPKGVLSKIANYMRKHSNDKFPYGYDTIESWALKEYQLTYVVYRPCLVQHIDYKSLISKCNGRRTPYFIDYLDGLNISYVDAAKPENKQKLIDLMNKKFK